GGEEEGGHEGDYPCPAGGGGGSPLWGSRCALISAAHGDLRTGGCSEGVLKSSQVPFETSPRPSPKGEGDSCGRYCRRVRCAHHHRSRCAQRTLQAPPFQ